MNDSVLNHLIKKLKLLAPQSKVLSATHDISYAALDQSSNVRPSLPMLVIKIANCHELVSVSQYLLSHHIAIVMRGAGTGKSGGAVAQSNAVIIDTCALNHYEINQENLTAQVEPGVILGDFQSALKKVGLFYPPDPASWATCTIGGNVAENAGGPSTLKYGTTKDYLLGGQAVIGTGELIDFGKFCPKGVAGYDLASLLCGSEGTLAIFTNFTLRLLPLPKDICSALFLYDDDLLALEHVGRIFTHGHRPRTLEYIDNLAIKALIKAQLLPHSLAKQSALLIECDASFDNGAAKDLAAIKQLLSVSTLDIESESLWQARYSLSQACTNYLGLKLSEDIALPLSQLKNFATWFKSQSYQERLVCSLFGHAGDGNLHVQIMFSNEALRPQAEDIRHEVLLTVLKLGGTLSAEHGIGLQKKAYLPLEQSPELISLQKRIKLAFDPHQLLNPGKIF